MTLELFEMPMEGIYSEDNEGKARLFCNFYILQELLG